MSEPDLYTRINAALGVAFEAADPSARKAAIGELARDLDALAQAGDEASRLIVLNGLATSSARLFTATDELADLDNGIEWGEDYLEAIADDSDRLRMAANLGIAYKWRFVRTDDRVDRDWMIEYCEEALTAPDLDDARRAELLSNLRTGYADRFFKDGTPPDLDTAIDFGEQALAAADSDRQNKLYLLGYLYHERFDVTHTRADADAAVRHAEQAMALSGPADPAWASVLALVADSHRQRFDRGGDPADLDTTIERLEQAVAATAVNDPQRARWLSNLSQDYHSLFNLTRRPETLQMSIDRLEEAIARTPDGHPDGRRHRSNLAIVYLERCKVTNDVADLDTSIALNEQALAEGLTGRSLGATLAGLAGGYYDRFLRTGVLADLDKSIEASGQALPHFGQDGPDRSACLSNLSIGHRRRYTRLGAAADLDAAVLFGERALRDLPEDHPQLTNRQLHLAITYEERWRRQGDAADLDAAIDLVERSLAGVFLVADDRALALNNLSGYYRARFTVSRDARDLELGVERAERAVAATSVEQPAVEQPAADQTPVDQTSAERTSWMWADCESTLAGAYLERYQNGGAEADLDAAIEHAERARAATSAEEPRHMGMLSNTATAYEVWADRRPVPDLVVSGLVEAASRATPAGPRAKAAAYRDIGMLALKTGHLDHAATMFRAAVEVLPQCAPRSLGWSDQEAQLAGSRGLISDTVAVHLALGDVSAAVELAELGRGIVLSNQLDARSDITALQRAAPDLASEFELLRAELDAERPAATGAMEESAWLVRRRAAADEWDRLLDRIRRIPELADFLAPPRITDLQRAAAKGAVVLVNTSAAGSDAVILRPDSVTRIPLDDLTPAAAQSHASALTGVHLAENSVVQTEGQGATPELLAWLWQAITKPVLTALGALRQRAADEPLPRVWWVPTGILNLLPLHAAELPGGPSALDHVISSYAPTIRVLLHGRHRSPAGTHRQLTVGMRYTPGLSDLLGSEAEAKSMQARYPGAVGLANADATVDAVLDALPHATFAHFACHGSSHPVWPSKCALHLHDGVLPVPEISRRRLRTGELAYLSACSTAQGSMTQADEALHLASAFQLAGYRHVVASLWPLHDTIAAEAAHHFYGLLGDPPSADLAPIALHQVVRRLRATYPKHPQVWASLVHNGP